MVAFVGLLIGIILGIVWDVDIPVKFSPYISVAIFACLDSVFGALRDQFLIISELIFLFLDFLEIQLWP